MDQGSVDLLMRKKSEQVQSGQSMWPVWLRPGEEESRPLSASCSVYDETPSALNIYSTLDTRNASDARRYPEATIDIDACVISLRLTTGKLPFNLEISS